MADDETRARMRLDGLAWRSAALGEAIAQPLLDDLAREYTTRYHSVLTPQQLREEMEGYPAHEFAPPDGELLLLLLRDGSAVAGGAFRRRVEPELGDHSRAARPSAGAPTAELKRMWTHRGARRQGLGRLVVAELESRAREHGYARVYLTTGPRQPEARGLYLSAGYTALFDVDVDPESIGLLPFEKWL